MRLHNRVIRPGFWTDAELIRHLPLEGRLYYMGLVQLADDSGCLYADTLEHKIHLFPGDAHITPEIIEGWLAVLEALGKVIRYQAGDRACLFLRNFHKHQKLRSPAPPGVPLPPWVTWTPSQQARRSGTYTVGSPNEPPEGPEKEIDEPPGDHSSTVQAPYGDDTVTNQEPRTIEPQNQEPASKLANTQAGARAKDPPPKEPADKRWVQGYRSLFGESAPLHGGLIGVFQPYADRLGSELVIEALRRGRHKRRPTQWAEKALAAWERDGITCFADLEKRDREVAAGAAQRSAGRDPGADPKAAAYAALGIDGAADDG